MSRHPYRNDRNARTDTTRFRLPETLSVTAALHSLLQQKQPATRGGVSIRTAKSLVASLAANVRFGSRGLLGPRTIIPFVVARIGFP